MLESKSVVAMIPARMGSSRFPGKPLASILGLSMIEHVYRRTAMCSAVNETYVATCDPEIVEAVEGFGGRAIMTSDAHERASDRVAEANERVQADVVVMVQGDEPMITAEMVELAVRPMLEDDTIDCVNLTSRIESQREFESRDTIKVLIDTNGFALYFSREPVPTSHVLGFAALSAMKQVCVIPFRKSVLQRYASLDPTPLEQAESVDMLRLLEHGYRVKLVECARSTHAVDTAEDLQQVQAMMAEDPITSLYTNTELGQR